MHRLIMWHGHNQRDTIEFPNLREAYAAYMTFIGAAAFHRIFFMELQRVLDKRSLHSYMRSHPHVT